eukprot:Amastigsp_a178355_16.p4 type:complete len:117 gc:universal Amastigsp_a178355_16:400-50(-)
MSSFDRRTSGSKGEFFFSRSRLGTTCSLRKAPLCRPPASAPLCASARTLLSPSAPCFWIAARFSTELSCLPELSFRRLLSWAALLRALSASSPTRSRLSTQSSRPACMRASTPQSR